HHLMKVFGCGCSTHGHHTISVLLAFELETVVFLLIFSYWDTVKCLRKIHFREVLLYICPCHYRVGVLTPWKFTVLLDRDIQALCIMCNPVVSSYHRPHCRYILTWFYDLHTQH